MKQTLLASKHKMNVTTKAIAERGQLPFSGVFLREKARKALTAFHQLSSMRGTLTAIRVLQGREV